MKDSRTVSIKNTIRKNSFVLFTRVCLTEPLPPLAQAFEEVKKIEKATVKCWNLTLQIMINSIAKKLSFQYTEAKKPEFHQTETTVST